MSIVDGDSGSRILDGDYYGEYTITPTGEITNSKIDVVVFNEYSTGLQCVILFRSNGDMVTARVVDLWREAFVDTDEAGEYEDAKTLVDNMIGLANEPVNRRRRVSGHQMATIWDHGGMTLEMIGRLFGVSTRSHVKKIVDGIGMLTSSVSGKEDGHGQE